VLIKLCNTFFFQYSFQSVLWFNIGSVDSFERNLENAQIDMNVEPPNFVPVIYKTELEAASITGILPTLLIIGNCFCLCVQ
jgi:AFG3 family protein